mmetsp:Transcript_26737/g.107090  ORF Transcript_26737/g.107090 Transcript_26737/m.107090 type:complete len:114 (-) Transcript_26737:1539-1880(-)
MSPRHGRLRQRHPIATSTCASDRPGIDATTLVADTPKEKHVSQPISVHGRRGNEESLFTNATRRSSRPTRRTSKTREYAGLGLQDRPNLAVFVWTSRIGASCARVSIVRRRRW